MYVTLALALILLVVMAWLILRPFLGVAVAGGADAPPVVSPPRDLGSARTAGSTSPTARPAAPAAVAPAAVTATSADALRASVEAAVAARKAAMMGHSCSGCDAPVDPGDAFCRACGTRVKED